MIEGRKEGRKEHKGGNVKEGRKEGKGRNVKGET